MGISGLEWGELAEPRKELLNGSKQSSVSMEEVCVCKCLIVHVDIKHLSSKCTHTRTQTHSSHQWGFCNYKSIHPLHLCVFFSQSGSNVLRYLISLFFVLYFLFLLMYDCAPSVCGGTMEANTDPKWLHYEIYAALKQTETTSEGWCNTLPCQCEVNNVRLDAVVACHTDPQLMIMMREDLDERWVCEVM